MADIKEIFATKMGITLANVGADTFRLYGEVEAAFFRFCGIKIDIAAEIAEVTTNCGIRVLYGKLEAAVIQIQLPFLGIRRKCTQQQR